MMLPFGSVMIKWLKEWTDNLTFFSFSLKNLLLSFVRILMLNRKPRLALFYILLCCIWFNYFENNMHSHKIFLTVPTHGSMNGSATLLVCIWVHQTEISPQLLTGLPWNFYTDSTTIRLTHLTFIETCIYCAQGINSNYSGDALTFPPALPWVGHFCCY